MSDPLLTMMVVMMVTIIRIVLVDGRDTLAIFSNYHPFFWFGEMEELFRWISKKAFQRPLSEFTLESQWWQAEVKRFCDRIEAG